MSRTVLIVIGVLVLLVVAGFVLLGTMTLSAPSSPVEKVIPNERFQK